MKSYTSLRNLYGKWTQNTTTANLTQGDEYNNDAHKKLLRAAPHLREKTSTLSLSAQTQFTELPYDCLQVTSGVKVTRSSQVYSPKEAPSREFWNKLNQSVVYSDIPEWYYVDDNQLGFYPIPASSGSNVVTVPYKKRIKDLSIADYTTGSISAIANGATAITGSGTTFTASMVGRFIRITESDTANKGDGEWYEIGSYSSATAIGLVKPYNGTTISAGTAAYTIGQMPLVHEDYHDLLPAYGTWKYWTGKTGDEARARAKEYKGMWDEGFKEFKATFGNKTNNYVIDDGLDHEMKNPNLYLTL